MTQDSHVFETSKFIEGLKKKAEILGSPTSQMCSAFLAMVKKNPSIFEKRTYKALKLYFKTEHETLPGGEIYNIVKLQKYYTRYIYVQYFRGKSASIESACQDAQIFLEGKTDISATTLRDNYSKMKKLLSNPQNAAYCRGLEYDFQIAFYGNDKMQKGTYFLIDEMPSPNNQS